MSGRWESNPRPEHGFRGYRLLALWSKVANQFDRLDSNQEVTPDAFVKGNLNYKVWGMASGIVDERWEGNWP
jgi:hypothetical protein